MSWITVTNNPERDGVEGYFESIPVSIFSNKADAKTRYKYDQHNTRFCKRYGVNSQKIIPEFGRTVNVRLI